MAVTPAPRAWEELFAARTRGGVGEGIAAMLSLLGVPGLISFAGGFPDPRTFPRERAASLLAEFAATGEASAFQYAPTRGLAGPLDAIAARLEATQGRRPADDELLITSGAIEALELVGKTFLDPATSSWSRRRRTSARSWPSAASSADVIAVPMDERRARGRRARAAARGRAAPEAPLHDPGPPEPGRREPVDRAPRALVELARRHGFLIVEDVAYRELAFDDERAAEPLERSRPTSSSRRARPRRRSSPACGSAGPSAPAEISRSSSPRSRTPTSAPARSASGSSRSTCAAAGSTSSSRSRARSTGASASACSAALERAMPAGVRWTTPHGGFFSWLTLPDGVDATDLAQRAVERGRRDRPRRALLPGRTRRRQRAPVVQHGRRVADRRRDRRAREARLISANRGARAARSPGTGAPCRSGGSPPPSRRPSRRASEGSACGRRAAGGRRRSASVETPARHPSAEGREAPRGAASRRRRAARDPEPLRASCDVVDRRDERAWLAARERPRMAARAQRAEVRDGVGEKQVAAARCAARASARQPPTCGRHRPRPGTRSAFAGRARMRRPRRASAATTAAAATRGTTPEPGATTPGASFRHRSAPPTSGRLCIRCRALRNAVVVSCTRATSESSRRQQQRRRGDRQQRAATVADDGGADEREREEEPEQNAAAAGEAAGRRLELRAGGAAWTRALSRSTPRRRTGARAEARQLRAAPLPPRRRAPAPRGAGHVRGHQSHTAITASSATGIAPNGCVGGEEPRARRGKRRRAGASDVRARVGKAACSVRRRARAASTCARTSRTRAAARDVAAIHAATAPAKSPASSRPSAYAHDDDAERAGDRQPAQRTDARPRRQDEMREHEMERRAASLPENGVDHLGQRTCLRSARRPPRPRSTASSRPLTEGEPRGTRRRRRPRPRRRS